MANRIIDIRDYLGLGQEGKERGAFGVWGSEGERTRFALPVWRAIQLVGGARGGIVSLGKEERDGAAVPFFILDLKRESAELGSPVHLLRRLSGAGVPALELTVEGDLAVLLGEDRRRWWFLQVLEVGWDGSLEGKTRETLLFLAGECAGLLFLRDLAS